jgi:hypothetical protein
LFHKLMLLYPDPFIVQIFKCHIVLATSWTPNELFQFDSVGVATCNYDGRFSSIELGFALQRG